MNRIVTLIVLMLFLTSCNGGDNNQNIEEDLISGAWSRCINSISTSELYIAVNEDGNWEDTFIEYSDLDCNTVDEFSDPFVHSGLYELGDKISLPNGDTAYEVTWFIGDAEIEECYSVVAVEDDLLFFGVVDETYDCFSLETRSIELDYEFPLFRD